MTEKATFGFQPFLDGHYDASIQLQLHVYRRSEAAFDLPIRLRRRGEFWVERIQVELTDPFDLSPLRRELPAEAVLLVMPEPRIGIPMSVRRRLPFGAPAQASRIFEARERFAGVRPYEPGDPLNRIHWKLTGHSGGLQTKLFEPTRTAEVLLVLDLAAGEPFWDSIFPEIAEDTIGWASFLARQAIGSGWRVGMIANTPKSGRCSRLSPGCPAIPHQISPPSFARPAAGSAMARPPSSCLRAPAEDCFTRWPCSADAAPRSSTCRR